MAKNRSTDAALTAFGKYPTHAKVPSCSEFNVLYQIGGKSCPMNISFSAKVKKIEVAKLQNAMVKAILFGASRK